MKNPSPPQIDAAQQNLLAVIQEVENKTIDPLKTPWSDIEKSVIKLLGGPYKPDQAEHQVIALGLAGILGQRLAQELQAFWFPNRESPEGAVLGFPDALIVLSPFGAVTDALSRAKLELLEETLKNVRASLAKVKFSATAASQPRLTPLDYARLFDPGFISFVALDGAKAEQTWSGTPERLIRDIQDAVNRASAQLPPALRQQFESQMVSALKRLEAGKPLKEQPPHASRILELMAHLFATTHGTGAAPEELWQDIVFPLLHIGAPENFPPLDDEEIELAKKGVDPLYIFLETVPYAYPAPEQGLLGEFSADELALPHPALEQSGSLRLVKIQPARLKELVLKFDGPKLKESFRRFAAYVVEKTGNKVVEGGEGEEILETAVALVSELKSVLEKNQVFCLRRTTEAEAASEGAMAVVRAALSGPRIILA